MTLPGRPEAGQDGAMNRPSLPTRLAPRLGEHTDIVHAEVLGLSPAEIARLYDAGIVAGTDGR